LVGMGGLSPPVSAPHPGRSGACVLETWRVACRLACSCPSERGMMGWGLGMRVCCLGVVGASLLAVLNCLLDLRR
jgi:hypothetical protein